MRARLSIAILSGVQELRQPDWEDGTGLGLYGLIAAIHKVGLNVTVEGDVSDFLGVKIERKSDGSIAFSQLHLIQQILKDL